jgi:hypothetical protein
VDNTSSMDGRNSAFDVEMSFVDFRAGGKFNVTVVPLRQASVSLRKDTRTHQLFTSFWFVSLNSLLFSLIRQNLL